LAVAETPCFAQGLGLYADDMCSECTLEIPAGQTRSIVVSGPVDGLADPRDFAGGEFRILGVPPGWQYIVVPNADILLIGDPLSSAGASFVVLSPPLTYCHHILTIDLTATSAQNDVALDFAPRVPPSDPAYNCPQIIVSDPPGSTSVCVEGAALLVNSGGICVVSVVPSGWGVIKKLYR
jgi:hypothetical protein